MTPGGEMAAGAPGGDGPGGDAPGGHAHPQMVLLDGALVRPEQAVVSAFDRGVLFGESLFETLKVVDGAPCLWAPHLARLIEGCDRLEIPLDASAVEAGVRRLLEQRPVTLGAMRIQVTGGEQPGGGRGMTAPLRGRRPRVVARVDEVSPPAESAYAGGVEVVTAAGLCRPLPGLKSGSYLASVAAKRRAEAAGAFECLLVEPGGAGVTEGSFTNVLAWDGATLVSSPAGGRLGGVTLAAVVDEARRAGIVTKERPLDPAGPAETGLMLTGSLVGVCPCARVDGRSLRDTAEMAALLRAALHQRERLSREEWVAAG